MENEEFFFQIYSVKTQSISFDKYRHKYVADIKSDFKASWFTKKSLTHSVTVTCDAKCLPSCQNR